MRQAANPAQCQIFSAGTICATTGTTGRRNQFTAAKMNAVQKMKPKKTFMVSPLSALTYAIVHRKMGAWLLGCIIATHVYCNALSRCLVAALSPSTPIGTYVAGWENSLARGSRSLPRWRALCTLHYICQLVFSC